MSNQYPGRPPRLSVVYSGYQPVFFLTFNTYKRQRILARTEIHELFVSFCQRAEDHAVCVGYYVIMPDHVHLFIWCDPSRASLQAWVKAIKNYLSKCLLALHVARPHWQEGFFDHLLRHAESYHEKSTYVLMNPVRAGLCEHMEDWPYSGKIADLKM